MANAGLKKLLDAKYHQYNTPAFIKADPISIPHLFTKKQDIEIAGLFAATLAWGQRPTILAKCKDLLNRMDNAPYQFVTQHTDNDLQQLSGFVHRTFNDTDLFYFIHFLKEHYAQHNSLETAFTRGIHKGDTDIGNALTGYHDYFFASEFAPVRTRKHVSTPARGSACKRLCMYLRWMVRGGISSVSGGDVDFGIWKTIKPAQLVCPVDLHVERVARKMELIQQKTVNWQTAIELTNALKQFDATDPVKYDIALFAMGILEKY